MTGREPTSNDRDTSVQSAVEAVAIKPCPFCGSPGKLIGCMGNWMPGGYEPDGSRITCSADRCGGVGWACYGPDKDQDAIAVWNQRAAMPAASEGEVLLPANPRALSMSIETVDRFINDDDSHVLHPEVGESIMLVVHELKRLRAVTAPSDQEKLANLLTAAVGDITSALMLAGKKGKIAEWTAPYVDALNEFDATTRLRAAGERGA